MALWSTFVQPHEFKLGDFIQHNSELYVVLNEEMLTDHFAFNVAALKWDFMTGKFAKRIERFVLPGHETYRVFGSAVRETYGLSHEPYNSKAWMRTAKHYQNDPMHNRLP